MNFETTVGLEVHIEMQTNSKAYSPSPVQYGAEQNTNTNVIDWGYPGVLPEINKGALEFGMRAALALHCDITQDVGFDRKNYFYPDNPKAYQKSGAKRSQVDKSKQQLLGSQNDMATLRYVGASLGAL